MEDSDDEEFDVDVISSRALNLGNELEKVLYLRSVVGSPEYVEFLDTSQKELIEKFEGESEISLNLL